MKCLEYLQDAHCSSKGTVAINGLPARSLVDSVLFLIF